jgi:arylsulfatase A-like enzyme
MNLPARPMGRLIALACLLTGCGWFSERPGPAPSAKQNARLRTHNHGAASSSYAEGVGTLQVDIDGLRPRILPRRVGPDTDVKCVVDGTLNGRTLTWRIDGVPVRGQGSELAAPHPAGAVITCALVPPAKAKRMATHADHVTVGSTAWGGNVLLLILDDVGIDRIGAYNAHPKPANTPVINALAEQGVLFRNAWAYPVCSPTRAGILTGRFGMNNGLGKAIGPNATGLTTDAWTLPEMLDEGTKGAYHHAAFGKWHISGKEVDGNRAPNEHGFQDFVGTLGNIDADGSKGYYDWTRITNGKRQQVTEYATSDLVNTTLRYIERTPEPWFVWVGFHAAHDPFEIPPEHLIADPAAINRKHAPDKFDAVLEALDTEIGRLLDGIPDNVRDNTTVILLGDNGTPEHAVRKPLTNDRAKGSMFEGGIHVPMVITGPFVQQPGAQIDAVVNHVDIFPTIGELSGAQFSPERLDGLDGVSLVPLLSRPDGPAPRKYAYAEYFIPNGVNLKLRHTWSRAIRDVRWKLMLRADGKRAFYDLSTSPFEERNLLAEGSELNEETSKALARLSEAMRTEFAPRE